MPGPHLRQVDSPLAAYQAAYRARPDVKEKRTRYNKEYRKTYSPSLEVRTRALAAHREWAKKPENRAKINATAKTRRRDPSRASYWVLRSANNGDRRAGFKNNLTLQTVERLIINGCAYCGETGLKMSLDRVDNSKGHTINNVVPACIRCNFTRGRMPYRAWCVVATAMKAARELGFFGEWEGDVPGHMKRSFYNLVTSDH